MIELLQHLSFPPCELLALSVGLLSCIGYVLWRSTHARMSLPPGPRGYPFIGNLLDWPFEHGWLTFKQWGDKFGTPPTSAFKQVCSQLRDFD